MPTFGWLMIAPPKRLPLRPGFVTENVAPREIVDRDLAAARARSATLVDRAHDAAHAELVGAADDRDDEAVGRVDRDADVHVLEDHERVVEHARVDRSGSRGGARDRATTTKASIVRLMPSFL